MGYFTGKTIIITRAGFAGLKDGSAGSIGFGIATAFAKEGANLAITGRNVKKLETAKERLEGEFGIRVLPVQADVNAQADNQAVVQSAVDQVMAEFGRIDALVNNAQASASGVTIADHTTAQFDLALYSGLYAAFYYMQACYPHLKETKGSVVNFASGAGLFGNYGQCAYAAAKEGIRGLTRVAATEWGPDGINANVWTLRSRTEAIAPGPTRPTCTCPDRSLRQRRDGDRSCRRAALCRSTSGLSGETITGRRHGPARNLFRFCGSSVEYRSARIAGGISKAPQASAGRGAFERAAGTCQAPRDQFGQRLCRPVPARSCRASLLILFCLRMRASSRIAPPDSCGPSPAASFAVSLAAAPAAPARRATASVRAPKHLRYSSTPRAAVADMPHRQGELMIGDAFRGKRSCVTKKQRAALRPTAHVAASMSVSMSLPGSSRMSTLGSSSKMSIRARRRF